MSARTSIIRWRFVIPVGIFMGAIVVFFVIFFDPLLARGIEIAGSKVNGAKVEVDGLKTKIFQGRLSIARLQVTNKEAPMQNIVDVGPLAFQLEFYQLISKRVIIPEASVEGLQFNTARKSSGALPRVKKKEEGKESAASKLVSKYSDRFKLNLGEVKFDAQEKVTFDAKDTAINKQGEALKTKADTLPDQFEAKVKALDVDNRLKSIEAKFKEVKATPEGLAKLSEAKKDLSKLKADVKGVRDEASAEIKGVKTGIAGLKDAKQKDMDDLLSRFNLDFLDPKRLVDGMIGPLVMERVHTVLGYVETARRVMPSKQEAESLPPKPRASGEDIKFWSPAAPPKFWLKTSKLSGSFQGISAAGLLQHVTSEPSRVGKPTTLDLKGSQGSRLFTGNVTLDHVTDVSKDSLSLRATGLDVVQMISTGALAGAVTAGTGAADIGFAVIDKNIKGHVRLDLSKLKIQREAFFKAVGVEYTPNTSGASREDAIKQSLVNNIAASLEKMPTISIEGEIGGTLSDPSLDIDSNLIGEFSRIIKNSVGDVIADQRKQLEADLQKLVQEQTTSLNAKLADLQGKLNSELGADEAKIQKKIEEASGLNLGGGSDGGLKIPSLDKLFKKH